MFIKMQNSEATLLQMKAQRILKAVQRLKKDIETITPKEFNNRLEAIENDAKDFKRVMSEVRNDKIIMIDS